jgi:hypothetical protein
VLDEITQWITHTAQTPHHHSFWYRIAIIADILWEIQVRTLYLAGIAATNR